MRVIERANEVPQAGDDVYAEAKVQHVLAEGHEQRGVRVVEKVLELLPD